MIFCILCDCEAERVIAHLDGCRTPLCLGCCLAYEMGQASPEAIIYRLEDVPLVKQEDGSYKEST